MAAFRAAAVRPGREAVLGRRLSPGTCEASDVVCEGERLGKGLGWRRTRGTVRGTVLGERTEVLSASLSVQGEKRTEVISASLELYKSSQKSKVSWGLLVKGLVPSLRLGRRRRESNNCSPIESSECLGSFLSYQADFKHFC